jgi:flagellar biosynthesis anti-sigma factor FlgM
MRIDPTAVAPTSLETQKSQQSAKATEPVAAVAPAAVVSLSSAATSVAPSSNTHAAQPTVTARLEKIRALLDAGEYPVDLDMLASRIVDDDLVRSRRS